MNNVLNTDKIIFGGDYNPDQWLDHPDILDKDIELFKEAHINCVSLAIFAWARLEPAEGVYDFDWLEDIINRLHENGISTILATPTAARPKWMADKYPEVMRVNADRRRQLFGMRHNHCQTSKIYREKTYNINKKLSERFKDNPAVILWHINNEYGGACYCDTCQDAFRKWLSDKYTTITNLNESWCTHFWSHTYTSFDEIEAPGIPGNGEWAMSPLIINWKRFATYITVDFMKSEIRAVRDGGSMAPVTTNFMYDFDGYNYKKFANELDIVSWDNYSRWHKLPDIDVAYDTAFQHDFMRCIKKAPFLLMESCPTAVNWQSVSKLRWPGLLETAGMQAVAHGSDSVQYFQMRQSRAGMEKFHGALIDHYGENDSRIFRECAGLGQRLDAMGNVTGGPVLSDVGLIYDRENIWGIENSFGPRNADMGIKECTNRLYKAVRRQNVNVDIIDCEDSLDSYKIVLVPMLYMFRDCIEDRLREFVRDGGIAVFTYWCGQVDENDRTFLGKTPHGLTDVLGLRHTEIDALFDDDVYHVRKATDISNAGVTESAADAVTSTAAAAAASWAAALDDTYSFTKLCNLIEVSTAAVLMTYDDDFYKGTPAVTVNKYGNGYAYFVGGNMEESFYMDFFKKICEDARIRKYITGDIPECVETSSRIMGTGKSAREAVFLQNFSKEAVRVETGRYTGVIGAYETVMC